MTAPVKSLRSGLGDEERQVGQRLLGHQTAADATCDLRADLGVAEVEARLLERGAGADKIGIGLLGLLPALFQRALGSDAGAGQVLGPLEVGAREGRARLRRGDGCLAGR